ncbi:non-ribosomal peptide synthase protein (TIGR01720 family)/amino acid adenylation domain-containing protein [Actinocorallia herbida]|uniref:Non-ribosomal peptide synthase protein (TIGR01720 family)/amino acid adenylation domain-containing protein n=1 Tax=Actinocorallia herbida TaxID=58109 RepID=A0A3N1D104_9ACTN|nr:non-ribosomal peptide synthetase [Actinocorallia herbida]ROO87215.1 non-ribosomal peptide synthase protein (TIGR01720 family)/amino acid adenylation domain-containing protein [Actinocorallia herbida]
MSTQDSAALRRALLRRRLAERDLADAPAAAVAPAGGALPVAGGQHRMWSLQQLDPATTGYNVRIALDLTGPLDADALIAAVHGLVARHDILRTTYRMGEDGRVRQVVHPELPPVVDRRAAAPAVVGDLCAALAASPFDLAADSPLRVGLYVTGPDTATFLVVAHHIAWDDGTSAVFYGELLALYRGVALPPARQFAEVALAMPAPDAEAGLAHWRGVLEPLPEPLALPDLTGADRSAGGTDQARGLLPGTAARVRGLARERGTTVFMVLLAAVTELLHRHTGAADLVIGAPVVNRDVPGGDEVIGYLGNTIPLRMTVAPDDTFATLLARAKAVCVGAYTHQDLDLDEVARAVDPDRTRAATGLFSVVLSLRAPVLEPFRAAGLAVARRHVPGDDVRFDLTVAVETDGDDLSVEANHPAASGAAEAVTGMLGHLDALLDALLAEPDRPLRALEALPERARLLGECNATDGFPVEERPFTELFAERRAAAPDAVAVLDDGVPTTYAELDERAARLARLLVAHGAGPETLVALGVPRSAAMVEAVLAIAKAGAAYVPVDPAYPADRIALMLSDARPALLVTTAEAASALPAGPPVLLLDDPATRARLAGLSGADLTDADRTAPLLPDHPAYVIYTSGSTGTPKGVVVSQRALSAHLGWALRRFPGLTGHTLVHSSLSFDFTVTPLQGTLAAGGTVEPCEPEGLGSAAGAATFLKITPSHLPLLPSVRFAGAGPRTLVIAGEELRGEALERWRPAAGLDVINEYGPTETTVGCLLHPVPLTDGEPVATGSVPVGSPVDHTVCHVLDDALRLAPVGAPGELYVGGVQLARGYLDRPGQTATRFVADPFGAPGARLYRTGDLVRRLPSGALEFLGRADEQVKIRGFRIEPGEIQAVLLGHPSVAEAVVAARDDGPSGRYLAAYVVAAEGTVPEAEALRAHVAAVLPEHFVPAAFTVLDALPLSPSGKADKRALPKPSFGEEEAADGPAREPATAAEAALARLFADVLGRPAVGLDESFFALGGDSIVAIRLVGRARKEGWKITPREVFAHRTVTELARVAVPLDAEPAAPAADASGSGPVTATPIVRAFAERGALGDAHHMWVLVDLPAGIDGAALDLAVQALLDHHDALRARLDRSGPFGGSLEFRPPGAVAAAEVLRRRVAADPSGATVAREREAAVARLAPADGRVLEAVRLDGPEASALLLVAHHLVVDGVSWRILVEDLATAYRDAAAGRKPALAPVPTSFRTWADGLAARAASRAAELPVWREILAGPDPDLGARRADPARDTWATVRTSTVRLSAATTKAVLTDVPAAFFAGVDDVLLAGLALALAEGGAHSASVLLEGHGRREAAVPGADPSRTVGWFTAQHPVRLDASGLDLAEALAGGPAAGALVKRVKEHLRSLPDHGIGYGMLRHLDPVGKAELSPLPEPRLGFNYLGRFDAPDGGWRIARDGLGAAYAPDMALPAGLVVNAVTEETPEGPRLTAHFMYAEGLFTEAETAALAARWTRALDALVRHSSGAGAGGRTPSDVSLVSLNQNQLDALEAKWRKA